MTHINLYRDIECSDLDQVFSAGQFGDLTGEESAVVEGHLMSCDLCLDKVWTARFGSRVDDEAAVVPGESLNLLDKQPSIENQKKLGIRQSDNSILWSSLESLAKHAAWAKDLVDVFLKKSGSTSPRRRHSNTSLSLGPEIGDSDDRSPTLLTIPVPCSNGSTIEFVPLSFPIAIQEGTYLIAVTSFESQSIDELHLVTQTSAGETLCIEGKLEKLPEPMGIEINIDSQCQFGLVIKSQRAIQPDWSRARIELPNL